MTTPDDPQRELEQARQALHALDASGPPEQAARLRARVAALESAAATPAGASAADARALLRHAAKVVLAIWAINLALSLTTYFAGSSPMLTFHFGLLLAVALLWWGNLRAASIVRWLAVVYLGSALFWLFAIARQPPDLTLSYLRLYPLQVLALAATELLTWLACLGIARQLGGEALIQARAAAGKPRRDMRIPLALGCACALVGMVLFAYLLRGPRVEHAEMLARQATGAGFRYYTNGMNVLMNAPASAGGTEKQVSATVVAWNGKVVYHLPVSWREP